MFLIASIFCNRWEARYHLDSYIKTSLYRGSSSIHEGDCDRIAHPDFLTPADVSDFFS